jgi:hypothetical protein
MVFSMLTLNSDENDVKRDKRNNNVGMPDLQYGD